MYGDGILWKITYRTAFVTPQTVLLIYMVLFPSCTWTNPHTVCDIVPFPSCICTNPHVVCGHYAIRLYFPKHFLPPVLVWIDLAFQVNLNSKLLLHLDVPSSFPCSLMFNNCQFLFYVTRANISGPKLVVLSFFFSVQRFKKYSF